MVGSRMINWTCPLKRQVFEGFVTFTHVLQYYPKLNIGHHTKPSDLYVC